MIMMLPFLTAFIGIVLAMKGKRASAIGVWVITLVIMLGWMSYHMTDTLNISL
jgi:hypothetical protein